MKGRVSTEKMQMQLRISKSNYEKQVVEIMIHQELNQTWSPILHSVDLVMAVRIPGLKESFLKLFKCTEGPVIVLQHYIFVYPNYLSVRPWKMSVASFSPLRYLSPHQNFESRRNTA